METDEKNLRKLSRLFAAMDEDSLTRGEFLKAFEAVVKVIKDLKETNSKEFSLMHQFLTKMSEKMNSDTSSGMSSAEKKMMDYCMKEMQKMYADHEKKMSQMDEKIAMVHDGLDGKDADEKRIVGIVLGKMTRHEELTAEKIRDMLEGLSGNEKLSIQAVGDLPKTIEDIEIKATGRPSGGLISKRIRFIDDETPSGTVNGVNTIFTITKFPESGSLKVYVNGQRQRVTTDYTLSGADKTITFLTAPPTGSILLVDFRY